MYAQHYLGYLFQVCYVITIFMSINVRSKVAVVTGITNAIAASFERLAEGVTG